MLSLSDEQIVMQGRSELRFVDVDRDRVRGLFTYDQGDIFVQRDMYAYASSSSSTNLYMAYSRLDYITNELYFAIDRVSVNTSRLSISSPSNIFHGLEQSSGDEKQYLTVRMAISEVTDLIAVCA